MNFRASKYFTRLLIYSLLIGSIPAIIVGIISYDKASSIVQDKVNQSSMATLQQTQLRMEQVLKTIDHSVTQYISSPLVMNAMALPYSASHYQVYNEMYQNMVRSQTFELTINNMTVLNLKGGWGVDNHNIFTFDEVRNLDQLLGYEKLPSFSQWVTDEDKSSPSISLVKKIPLNSLKADGLAIVTIAESQLAGLLAADNRIGSILVMDKDYRLLSRSDQKVQEFGLGQLVAEMHKRNDREGQFNVELDGDITSVILRKSSYNGWMYVSAISIKDITQDSRTIGWVTLIVCLITVLVTGGLALLGSRTFYRPVGQLVATMTDRFGEPPKEARADEFAMIGSRLQAMLQNESRLSAQLTGQVRDLKQFFVMKLIRGEERESELAVRLREYGYSADWEWHAVLAIQIDSLERSPYNENDRDLLLFAIANIAGELIPGEERLDPVVLEQSQITVVGGAGATDVAYKNRLFALAELIQQTVLQYLKLHISIGISLPHKRLIDIALSAEQALEALRYRIRFGPESVLFIDDVQPEDLVSSVFPHRAAKDLYDAVKLADRTKSDELLERCIELIFQEQADWRQYRMSLVRLYTMLIELGQSEATADTFPPDQEKQLFDRLLDLESQEEIRQWFSDVVIAPIMGRLEQQRKSHTKKISDQITELIEQRFDTEITLEACAKELNYHPNHLGPLFSREKGISFSEYLQNYRLQMAKMWLIETDMRIGDIAERLTYTNPQNFIRFFRKMENMTPGQYRELNGQHKI
ncbi:helix-turn-helix domain-containing protein [Paenibacillus whitsoniae]|uniref:Helix-turn-helix domain-containing protein n=1 Tax=Paenibacillus whitsoniae TaxID=2496558 RepID=A0A3S0BS90_9BACL|nr:helix-turn-helix domain-containing protein [Paenibacillus whitsoniae]RTE06208.1 helix-turn-helix domain-containing protein [Paenibacillus whitsoniae]